MARAYLGLGSNLGSRIKNLEQACLAIEIEVGGIIKKSPVYESEPWGFSSDYKFLNMVVCIETLFSPSDLLLSVLEIESKLGRIRKAKKGYFPRKIDIDILLYDQAIISTRDLVIPHPLMHERNFVLKPLVDIAPDLNHPVLNRSIGELAASSPDNTMPVHYTDKLPD